MKNNINKKYNRGFVAIVLIIIISSIMFVLNSIKFIEYGHFFDMVQRKQYRYMNYYNAYSCIDQSILLLNYDYFFLTEKDIEFKDFNCAIDYIRKDNFIENQRLIDVFGNYKNIFVHRKAIVKLFDNHIEIISIE